MVERGIVTKLKRDKAIVSFDRKAACDKCRMCAVSKGGMKVEITIKNTLNKNVGDFVSVQMGEKFVITAAIIVYVIPLLLTVGGMLIGQSLGEMWQLILAAIGLVVGFVIAIILDKALRKRKGFVPEMVDDVPETEWSTGFLDGNDAEPAEKKDAVYRIYADPANTKVSDAEGENTASANAETDPES